MKGSFCKLSDKNNIIYSDEFNFFNVVPETVSQYIGKNDINDNMIFEGDIVEAIYGIGYAENGMKIVGNIYDNPDILVKEARKND